MKIQVNPPTVAPTTPPNFALFYRPGNFENTLYIKTPTEILALYGDGVAQKLPLTFLHQNDAVREATPGTKITIEV